MAPSTPIPKSHTGSADTTKAVDEFLSNLDHPFKAELQEIRETILGANPAITEGIKWKAPSFRTTDYFATTNLREKSGLGLILHLGAKVRDTGPDGLPIRDPEGLLKWLAKDRATIVFKDMNDVTNKKGALVSLIRQWVAYV